MLSRQKNTIFAAPSRNAQLMNLIRSEIYVSGKFELWFISPLLDARVSDNIRNTTFSSFMQNACMSSTLFRHAKCGLFLEQNQGIHYYKPQRKRKENMNDKHNPGLIHLGNGLCSIGSQEDSKLMAMTAHSLISNLSFSPLFYTQSRDSSVKWFCPRTKACSTP